MINLTETAVAEVNRLLAERSQPDGLLRIGVATGGCSGLQYSMDLASKAGEDDLVMALGSLRIACDRESLPYLRGLTVDFSPSLVGGGFKFRNPNAKRSCGCGTSFRI